MSKTTSPTRPWQRFRREGLSWSLSLVFHGSILAVLAMVSVSQPYLVPDDVSLTISKTDEPTNSEPLQQQASPSMTAPEQLRQLLNQTPLVQPPMLAQMQPPKMTLPKHLKAPDVSTDVLMQQLAASDLAAGSDNQQIIPSGLLEGTTENFQNMISQWRGSGLDVVLVLDVTGSMGPYLDQAKLRLRQIMGVITGILGDKTDPMKIVRFGVVAYADQGDFGVGNAPYQFWPLERNQVLVQRFISRQHKRNGGDEPEPLDLALKVATDPIFMNWVSGRKAVIILVTDAPVHDANRDKLAGIAEKFVARFAGRINTIGIENPKYTPKIRLAAIADLQTIAHFGKGEAFLLDDQQAFWEHLIVSIFGREYQTDVNLILKRYLKKVETVQERAATVRERNFRVSAP